MLLSLNDKLYDVEQVSLQEAKEIFPKPLKTWDRWSELNDLSELYLFSLSNKFIDLIYINDNYNIKYISSIRNPYI